MFFMLHEFRVRFYCVYNLHSVMFVGVRISKDLGLRPYVTLGFGALCTVFEYAITIFMSRLVPVSDAAIRLLVSGFVLAAIS